MILLFPILFLLSITVRAQEWTNYTVNNSGLPVNAIHNITFDSNGTRWIGTWGGGLVRFNDTSWTVYDTSNSPLPHNNIYSILIDKDNTLWIGTFGGGLAKLDDTAWTIFDTSNSGLTDNTIYDMVFDEAENIYISTWGHSYLRFDRKNEWINYNQKGTPFYNKKVSALLYEGKSKLWVGCAYGLYIVDNDTIINPGEQDHNLKQGAYSIVKGKDNILWVAFKTGGIAYYRNENWEYINYSNSPIPSNTVYHLNIDNKNNLWISTFGTGLAKLADDEWTIFNKENSPLTDDFIFSTAQDKDGCIWICTLKGGIFVIPAGN